MRLPEGLVYLYAALRGRSLMACEWLAIGKMLGIPRLTLFSLRWRTFRNPHDVTAWLHRAHIHINVYDENGEALVLYERALAANPERPELWKAKGDLLGYCNNDRGALEAYDRALALTGEKVPLLIAKSRLYLWNQNRPEQALETVDAALAIDPVHIPALAWKQAVLMRLGKGGQVEALNDRILEIDPRNADALLHRAQVLRKKGKGELALGVYDAFLLHYPDQVGIWQVRAELLLELHRYPDALESVERSHSFDPEWKEWNMAGQEVLRGDIHAKLQRHREALAAYDRVLAKDPDWNPAVIWEKKAGIHFALADYPGTVAACDRAIELAKQERRNVEEVRRLRDAARLRIS